MPQLELFVVADSVVIDQRTGSLSILNVFDEVRPRRFPFKLIRLEALSTWLLDDADHGVDFQVTVELTGPIPDELPPFTMNFTGEGRAQRILHTLRGLPVFSPGDVRFELRLNGTPKAHHTIVVGAADPSEPSEVFVEVASPGSSGQDHPAEDRKVG